MSCAWFLFLINEIWNENKINSTEMTSIPTRIPAKRKMTVSAQKTMYFLFKILILK